MEWEVLPSRTWGQTEFWEHSILQGAKLKNKKPINTNRGRELNTNFFLKLFEHLRDIPAKLPDIPPKKFDFPGFEGHTELFGPHPFT